QHHRDVRADEPAWPPEVGEAPRPPEGHLGPRDTLLDRLTGRTRQRRAHGSEHLERHRVVVEHVLGRHGPGPAQPPKTRSLGTISLPSGIRETGISLRLAIPIGMPMIETKSGIAVTTCPIASQIPATTTQITLPTADITPEVGLSTTVRPKGHSAYPAIRNEAMPNGIVTISTKQMI